MSQPADTDYSIDAGLGAVAWRQRIDSYIDAILTLNSGSTAPTTTFPGMFWLDTSQSPPEWNVRNQADSGWDLFARIDPTNGIEILNEGAAVVGLANTGAFTENQTIDRTGSAGVLTIRSDRTTGIAASVDLAGHDDGGNDTTFASIDMEITDDTDGSEDGQVVLRVLQNGAEVARMSVGATVTVNGVLNATTLQEGGTAVSDLVETAKGSMTEDQSSAAAITVPNDITRGERNRFVGTSASTWTVNSGNAGDVYPIMNDGTAAITFVEGAGVAIRGGLALSPQQVCTLEYVTSTRVFIYGQNV